jgi:hypothetical protein
MMPTGELRHAEEPVERTEADPRVAVFKQAVDDGEEIVQRDDPGAAAEQEQRGRRQELLRKQVEGMKAPGIAPVQALGAVMRGVEALEEQVSVHEPVDPIRFRSSPMTKASRSCARSDHCAGQRVAPTRSEAHDATRQLQRKKPPRSGSPPEIRGSAGPGFRFGASGAMLSFRSGRPSWAEKNPSNLIRFGPA